MQTGQITKLSSMITFETIANNGGTFAIDPTVPNLYGPTSGYMVSCHKDKERVFELADVKNDLNYFMSSIQWMIMEYRQILQFEGMYLGTWVNDGKIYVDISTNVQSIHKAVELAQDNNQLAIWSVENSKELSIPQKEHSCC